MVTTEAEVVAPAPGVVAVGPAGEVDPLAAGLVDDGVERHALFVVVEGEHVPPELADRGRARREAPVGEVERLEAGGEVGVERHAVVATVGEGEAAVRLDHLHAHRPSPSATEEHHRPKRRDRRVGCGRRARRACT